MGFWSDLKEESRHARERDQRGGFEAKAAYLGGHPEATDPVVGKLYLDAEVRFDGRTSFWTQRGMSMRPKEANFSIDLTSIEAVELRGQDELKNAPKGYWAPLPVPWLPGYGSQRKHPITGGKLLSLLTVSFADKHGDSQTVVFANANDWGPLPEYLANRIVAARYRAKEEVT